MRPGSRSIVAGALALTAGSLVVAAPRVLGAEEGGEDHSAHHAMHAAGERRYTRSVATYRVPEVALVDQEGQTVALRSVLDSPRPVALNFMFTTCTTICPVMTATLSRMRTALGADAEGLRTVSISIDPEHDTPAVMKAYAGKFGATSDWQFLTGGLPEVTQVLRAFDAYAGSKVNHRPLTFFRAPGAGTWVRIDGLASGADLASEYRQLVGKPRQE